MFSCLFGLPPTPSPSAILTLFIHSSLFLSASRSFSRLLYFPLYLPPSAPLHSSTSPIRIRDRHLPSVQTDVAGLRVLWMVCCSVKIRSQIEADGEI